MRLNEMINGIKTKEDLLIFLSALRKDLISNNEEWENPSLESYLEAMESWIETMDSYYKNTNQLLPEQPSWKMFADILYASKYYE